MKKKILFPVLILATIAAGFAGGFFWPRARNGFSYGTSQGMPLFVTATREYHSPLKGEGFTSWRQKTTLNFANRNIENRETTPVTVSFPDQVYLDSPFPGSYLGSGLPQELARLGDVTIPAEGKTLSFESSLVTRRQVETGQTELLVLALSLDGKLRLMPVEVKTKVSPN